MDEATITESIASFLVRKHWIIISINAPFSGRSVWIKPNGGRRGKGALIPDVIAWRGEELMIVESSAPYKISDERKLLHFLDPRYVASICTMFESRSVSSLRLSVGLPAADSHRVVSSDVAVLVLDDAASVTVLRSGVPFGICGV